MLAPRRREKGQTIALAAVLMVAMVGLLAFVVDAGMFIVAHQELQKAVDVAAQAAVTDLGIVATGGGSIASVTTDGSPLNAQVKATAISVAQANFGIANRLCTVTPPTIVSPTPYVSTYIPVGSAAGDGVVYTIAVTARCEAGYTFGRILDLVKTPVSATGSSGIGALRANDCPIPFVVPQGPGTLDALHGWGWDPGVPMLLPIGSQLGAGSPTSVTFSGMVSPLTGMNGITAAVSKDDTIALTGANASATDLANWIKKSPCVSVSTGTNSLGSNGGTTNFPVGPLLSSFATRFGTSSGPGQITLCPDGLNPQASPPPPAPPGIAPVAKGDWTLNRYSNCLAAIPVIDSASYDTLLNTSGGNYASLNVLGFNLLYIAYVAKDNGGSNPCANIAGTGSDNCLFGYYLRPAVNGTLGILTSDGQPLWRPVR